MRKKSLLMWVVLLLVSFSVMAGGCGGSSGGSSASIPVPTPSPAPSPMPDTKTFIISGDHTLVENAVIQPNVYNLGDNDILSASYAKESDKSKAAAPNELIVSSAAKTYQVGDVVVAPPSAGDSAYGFAAVVEAVQFNSDGTQQLQLRQATFVDILADGDLFFSMHSTPSTFIDSEKASILSNNGGAHVAGLGEFADMWNSLVNGTYSTELPLDVPLPTVVLPKDVGIDHLELGAELSRTFKGSCKFDTQLTVKPSFSFLLSIRDSNIHKVASHFPYSIGFESKWDFEGAAKAELIDLKFPSASVPVVEGVAWVTIGLIAIPIPWNVNIALALKLETALDGTLDLNYSTSWTGDAGVYWEGGEFHVLDPMPKSNGANIKMEPSASSSIEVGAGPKVGLDVFFAPLTSITITAGAKFKHKLGESIDTGKIDGKFKVSLDADLLKLFNKVNSALDKLKFSVVIIDHTFPLWSKEDNPAPDPDPTPVTAPDIEWQKSLGGSGWDEAYSIQQTSDGGYIVAGRSNSTNGDVTGNHGSYDYWIVKLNSSGGIEWQKSLGGSGYGCARSIQQTTDGGYIVAGHSNSNDGDVSGNHGGYYDCWIVKLNSSGGIEWQKSLGGSGWDDAYSIQQTSDGGYIVAGESNSTDGDVTGNHGNFDYWIVKLNSSGVIEWQKSLGGSDGDTARSIQQTTDGGYIVAGLSSSTNGDVTGNHVGVNYWIVKLNSSGVIEWQKSLDGYGGNIANSIQQTTDGGYIVAGESDSTDGDVTGNHGGYDYRIVKLNSLGVIEWQKSLGGSREDYANSIRQTTDGGYIVAGHSYSTDGDVTGSHGGYDYWIVKLNSSGGIQWQKSLGGSGTDFARSIQQTTDGGYIVAGESRSTDGDVTGNHGGGDYWIVKLKP